MTYADQLELHMLTLVNQERSSRNLSVLQLETNLNSSAEDHSKWILESDLFSHIGVDRSSSTQRMAAAGFDLSGSWGTAENLAIQSTRGASGYLDDVEDLHTSLMNSAGHRANILNPDLEYIGIGIELGSFEYNIGALASIVVTQNFGRTQGSVDLDDLMGGQSTNEVPKTLIGLEISDTLIGDDSSEIIIGNAGSDDLQGAGGHDTIDGGTGSDTIYGGAGNDSILGNTSTDILYGEDGNDTLRGGTGADTIYGGEGNDSIFGNTGVDLVYGGGGNDWISPGNGADEARGGTGNDTIIGRTGWDTIYGDAGDDSLSGSEGADLIFGGTGNDYLAGGSGEDTLHGQDGNDEIYGNLGADSILGGDGNDTLYGATGDDTIRGGDGNDLIYGAQGVDRIEGGAGNDTLLGGTQADTFIFGTGDGNDVMTGFEVGADQIRLEDGIAGSASDGQDVIDMFGSITNAGVVLTFGANLSLTFDTLDSYDQLSDSLLIIA